VAFTDDDLKQLKTELDQLAGLPLNAKLLDVQAIVLIALLARLEAAEKVILEMPSRCYICEENVGTLTLVELFKAWLTSKGEGK